MTVSKQEQTLNLASCHLLAILQTTLFALTRYRFSVRMESIMTSEVTDIKLGTLELEALPGSPDQPPENHDVKKGETIIEGENPAFEDSDGPEELAPVTYVDFMPRCISTGTIKGQRPEFADFGTVVEQANQWLESMPQYAVCKCETVARKLGTTDFNMDNDAVLIHMSSHGSNILLMGLRLWLMPKMDPEAPVQKLSYISVLPDHNNQGVGDLISNLISQKTGFQMTAMQVFQGFNNLGKTLEKLNRQFQLNPLPGSMLNVETVKLLITDNNPTPNPESTCWVETGRTNRLYLYALRVFYVIGEPAFETLAIHDVTPDFIRNTEGINHRLKFATYRSTVEKASSWLKKQQGVKVLNIQTTDVKLDKYPNGNVDFDTFRSGHGEMSFDDVCQFVKVLRIYYIKKQKGSPVDTEQPSILASRLFVPVRKNQTGKAFESFSKTMQRVIAWLNVTKAVPLSMESVTYPVNPDSWGTGVVEDKVETSKTLNSGRYILTCIRLYFSQDFKEPSPDLLPPTQEDEEGWMCVIS